MGWGRGGGGGLSVGGGGLRKSVARTGGVMSGNPYGVVAGAGASGGGGWMGKAGRGDFGGSATDISENLGFGDRKAREGMEKYNQSLGSQRNEAQGVLDQMKTSDDQYYGQMQGHTAKYTQELDSLKDETQRSANDARTVYKGTVQPELKNIMEDARKEAGSAMTLQQAGDPNNAVHQGVRQMYDQQAQGVGRQGLADVGVLQAMGAQAAAGQMGGMPMTGGQMQAIMGANQTQAGMAMARAQQQMQSLKEQGIDRGFSESNNQYERGQRAKDRHAGSVRDIQSADEIYQDRAGRFRGEKHGYGGERFGVQAGLSGLRYGQQQGQSARQLGMQNDYYGGQQAGLAGQVAAANAGQAGKMGMIGSLAGAGIGAMAGGPAGAAAGSQVGGQAAATQAPQGGVAQNMGGGYDYGGGANYPVRPEDQYATSYSPGAYGNGYGPRARG